MCLHTSRAKIKELRALAREGFRIQEIADMAGVSRPTVRKYAGMLIAPYAPPAADVARLRRIVAAAESPGASRAEKAVRFGLASANSFDGMVSYARRRLAAEGACSRPA